MNTPWGVADSVEVIADGIWQVGTPSHGGIKLSCKRQAMLPANAGLHNFNKALAWWEEDCDWCVPYLVFAEDFKAYLETLSPSDDYQGDPLTAEEMFEHNMAQALQTASRHHPEFYRWYLANRKA